MADILALERVQNPFFCHKNSKSQNFPIFCRSAFLKIFQDGGLIQDGGTIQDGGFLTLFSKIWQKSVNLYFSVS
jgi:hypothetical protein